MTESTAVVVLGEDEISQSVAFINEQVQTAKKAYLEIGQHVFQKFFNGDEALLRSKNPNKGMSFNKLLEHSDLMMSRKGLENAVGTFIQWQQLKELPQGEKVVGLLTQSHQEMLLPVKDVKKKLKLAKKVVDESLSVRDFRKVLATAQKTPVRVPKGTPALMHNIQQTRQKMNYSLLGNRYVSLLAKAKANYAEGVHAEEKEAWLDDLEAMIGRLEEIKTFVQNEIPVVNEAE